MSEEQLQECLRLRKSTNSLLVVIEALGSPLGPHPESDLTIDLYSGSTPIANMDKCKHLGPGRYVSVINDNH
jgi:hypothetical protein